MKKAFLYRQGARRRKLSFSQSTLQYDRTVLKVLPYVFLLLYHVRVANANYLYHLPENTGQLVLSGAPAAIKIYTTWTRYCQYFLDNADGSKISFSNGHCFL